MERFEKAAPTTSETTTIIAEVPPANGHTKTGPSPPTVKIKTIKVEPRAPKVNSETTPPTSSASSPPDDASDSDVSAPPKKKRKRGSNCNKEMDDAQLAAMLQAQENIRTRATRGGGTKKKTVVKKRSPKKKSDAKVKADDDSDMELDSSGEVKEKPKKGGFHKQYHLGEALADLVGQPTVCSSLPPIVEMLCIRRRDNANAGALKALSPTSRQKDLGIHQRA